MTIKKTTNPKEGNPLKEFFDSIRDENEGKITKSKLQAVAKELGFSLTDAEIRDMIEVADPVGDGAVTYKGLANMVHKSQQDFPRLETSIETIRRELTSLSVTAAQTDSENKENSGGQSTSSSGDQANDDDQPTPSTSRLDSDSAQEITADQTLASRLNYDDDDDDYDDNAFETDNGVIIGKVMKARDNDNRKVIVTSKGKGKSTKGKHALVIPISKVDEDGESSMIDNKSPCHNNDVDNEHLNNRVTDTAVDTLANDDIATSETVSPLTTDHEDDNVPSGENRHDKTRAFADRVKYTKDGADEISCADIGSAHTDTPEDYQREVQSRQSAATRFSLDANVITAVDRYHSAKQNHRKRVRMRQRLDRQPEEEEFEVDEVDKALQETDNVDVENETPRDSRTYIRDKTRGLRRKASLTKAPTQQSVEEAQKPAASKPVVKKRSLSRSRVPKAKGPSRPSDKHSVFYTGLGCALKISQLRTKQRLLYQMWQLVYEEAMMRMRQTHRYDYEKDPAPLAQEKPKPKKKLKQRNSLD